jgi:hypothetical protein
LEYYAEGTHERFKVIEFAVSAHVTNAFLAAVREVKEADWRPLHRLEHSGTVPTGQQWAEVCFVPTWGGSQEDAAGSTGSWRSVNRCASPPCRGYRRICRFR